MRTRNRWWPLAVLPIAMAVSLAACTDADVTAPPAQRKAVAASATAEADLEAARKKRPPSKGHPVCSTPGAEHLPEDVAKRLGCVLDLPIEKTER